MSCDIKGLLGYLDMLWIIVPIIYSIYPTKMIIFCTSNIITHVLQGAFKKPLDDRFLLSTYRTFISLDRK